MTREERLARDGVTDPVLFYGGPFSNFSPLPVWMPIPPEFAGGREDERHEFETSEHYYQAMKCVTANEFWAVARVDGPGACKRLGQTVQLRPDWGDTRDGVCYAVMLAVLFAKTEQHADVRVALEQTGDRHIYEDSPTDNIWGWRRGDDYGGRNLLGEALMEVRVTRRELGRQ